MTAMGSDLAEGGAELCDLMGMFSSCRVGASEMELPSWKTGIALHLAFLPRDNKKESCGTSV
jgi:hypothetical protein